MRPQRHKQHHARCTVSRRRAACGRTVETTGMLVPTDSEQDFKSQCKSHRCGDGFTLLEMLLALALCGIVMSGVYGAIHLHVQLRTSSRNRINVAQVSSTIVENFSTDVQSIARTFEIVRQPDNQSEQSTRFRTTEIEVSDIEESDLSARHLNLEGVVSVEPVHFQGTANSIVVLSGSPNPRFPMHTTMSSANIRDKSGLARQIAWWFSNGETIRLPASIENEKIKYHVVHAGHRRHRIVRAERPVQYRSVRPQTADDEVLFSHVADVAEEVAGMHFRYFDGRVWTNAWDSHELKTFPTAVELTVQFTADSRPPLRCIVSIPNADIIRTQDGHL